MKVSNDLNLDPKSQADVQGPVGTIGGKQPVARVGRGAPLGDAPFRPEHSRVR
jgi:hypothetical protein